MNFETICVLENLARDRVLLLHFWKGGLDSALPKSAAKSFSGKHFPENKMTSFFGQVSSNVYGGQPIDTNAIFHDDNAIFQFAL